MSISEEEKISEEIPVVAVQFYKCTEDTWKKLILI